MTFVTEQIWRNCEILTSIYTPHFYHNWNRISVSSQLRFRSPDSGYFTHIICAGNGEKPINVDMTKDAKKQEVHDTGASTSYLNGNPTKVIYSYSLGNVMVNYMGQIRKHIHAKAMLLVLLPSKMGWQQGRKDHFGSGTTPLEPPVGWCDVAQIISAWRCFWSVLVPKAGNQISISPDCLKSSKRNRYKA